MSEIAVFSTSIDEPTYGPVLEELNSRGYEAWIYRADMVASAKDKLDIHLEDENELTVYYNDIAHKLGSVCSAWFRHPGILNLNIDDKAKQLCLEQEVEAIQNSFWQHIPDKSWLNHPEKMKQAQSKLAQLALASELGFKIPETVVSNDWSAIDNRLDNDEIAVKMTKGLMYEQNQTKVLYTTILDRSNRSKLRDSNPFPAIYQQFLSKHREWRITIVGDDVFEAAIYTTDNAKDDWRRHQLTTNVQFRKESMPEAEIQRCVEYLRRYDLLYGAFDFIEDKDGKITFLECNTNGQYKWLEELLDFPISIAITDKLIEKYHQ